MAHERKLPAPILEEAIGKIRNGKSVRAVSREYDISHTSLNRLLRCEAPDLVQGGRYKRATLNLPEDPAFIGYLAGIIDGEGSITRNGRGWGVVVYNTSEELMKRLQSLGGRKYTRPPHTTIFFTTLPQYGWVVGRLKDLEILLEAVIPYLIIKREKAEETLALVKQKLAAGKPASEPPVALEPLDAYSTGKPDKSFNIGGGSRLLLQPYYGRHDRREEDEAFGTQKVNGGGY